MCHDVTVCILNGLAVALLAHSVIPVTVLGVTERETHLFFRHTQRAELGRSFFPRGTTLLPEALGWGAVYTCRGREGFDRSVAG